MKIIKLETQEQFNTLKKGDLVIVEWRGEPHLKISAYRIYGMIDNNELLLSKKRNHYICVSLYLNKESNAWQAWLVTN